MTKPNAAPTRMTNPYQSPQPEPPQPKTRLFDNRFWFLLSGMEFCFLVLILSLPSVAGSWERRHGIDLTIPGGPGLQFLCWFVTGVLAYQLGKHVGKQRSGTPQADSSSMGDTQTE